MRIGVVGLGLAGGAIARRLMQQGMNVSGYDIDEAARRSAQGAGVTVMDSARSLAAESRVVLLSLPDSRVVHEVLWGDHGISDHVQDNTTIFDTSTGRPADAEYNHYELSRAGIVFAEATLVGSSAQIAAGDSIALVGASDMPPRGEVIETLCRRVHYMGGPGQGARAKLILNHALGLHRLVLAETLTLAERTGFDAAQILGILRDSPAYSAVMDAKGPKMVKREFAPVARLAQHSKDVDLIREMGKEAGARMPLAELHHALLQEALAAGLGPLDNAAIVDVFRDSGRA